MMTCLEFEELLHESHDARNTELAAELLAHVEKCAACREVMVRLRHLEEAAAVWRNRLPGIDVAAAVLHELSANHLAATDSPRIAAPMTAICESHAELRRSSPRAGLVALLASAVALLIMASVGWRISRTVWIAREQSSNSRTVDVVTKQTTSPSAGGTAPVAASERQLDVLLNDARVAYVALASQAWQQASQANLILPPAETAMPLPSDDALDGVPDSLARPLAPLGRELRQAVDSLLDRVFDKQDSST
jgi:hypothetical protein